MPMRDTLERTSNVSILVTKLKTVCAVPHIMENTLYFQYFKERACLVAHVGRNSKRIAPYVKICHGGARYDFTFTRRTVLRTNYGRTRVVLRFHQLGY